MEKWKTITRNYDQHLSTSLNHQIMKGLWKKIRIRKKTSLLLSWLQWVLSMICYHVDQVDCAAIGVYCYHVDLCRSCKVNTMGLISPVNRMHKTKWGNVITIPAEQTFPKQTVCIIALSASYHLSCFFHYRFLLFYTILNGIWHN